MMGEDLEVEGDRVLRGGAFYFTSRHVRCAALDGLAWNGFREFRASVFPRCRCLLSAEARRGGGRGRVSASSELPYFRGAGVR
jgi:hypothetical protein